MIIVTHPIDTEKLSAWRQAKGEQDWPQYYLLPTECQSTSHDHSQCWGELWQCDECLHWVCHADGTDDGTSDYLLCDACWAEKHKVAP